MGRRITEISEHPIAQILRNMPVIAFDDRRTGLLVSTDYFTQLFRVELLGEGGRAHQVTEHDSELTAFARRQSGVRRPKSGVWGLGT